jgi:hypothetical protein
MWEIPGSNLRSDDSPEVLREFPQFLVGTRPELRHDRCFTYHNSLFNIVTSGALRDMTQQRQHCVTRQTGDG